jgi:hypothetical protein
MGAAAPGVLSAPYPSWFVFASNVSSTTDALESLRIVNSTSHVVFGAATVSVRMRQEKTPAGQPGRVGRDASMDQIL